MSTQDVETKHLYYRGISERYDSKTGGYCSVNSDKYYFIDLKQSGSDWVVNFTYGRRQSATHKGSKIVGTKTPYPVSFWKARQLFNDLIASKERKGYKETLEYNLSIEDIAEIYNYDE